MERIRSQDPLEGCDEQLAEVQDAGNEAVGLPGVEQKQDEAGAEALGLPYADLMRLSGYPLPGEAKGSGVGGETVATALFANLTEDEREELLEYLAWYRTRRRSKGGTRRRR